MPSNCVIAGSFVRQNTPLSARQLRTHVNNVPVNHPPLDILHPSDPDVPSGSPRHRDSGNVRACLRHGRSRSGVGPPACTNRISLCHTRRDTRQQQQQQQAQGALTGPRVVRLAAREARHAVRRAAKDDDSVGDARSRGAHARAAQRSSRIAAHWHRHSRPPPPHASIPRHVRQLCPSPRTHVKGLGRRESLRRRQPAASTSAAAAAAAAAAASRTRAPATHCAPQRRRSVHLGSQECAAAAAALHHHSTITVPPPPARATPVSWHEHGPLRSAFIAGPARTRTHAKRAQCAVV